MPKGEKVKEPKAEKVKHNRKVTSEDVPGDGMANKAARAIEKRQRERKELLDSL